MRLPPQLIERIARRMVQSLSARDTIRCDHPGRTAEKVARLIAADLAIEDQITEEARMILLDHEKELRGEDVEYHKLILRVKAQLAAKRGYVL